MEGDQDGPQDDSSAMKWWIGRTKDYYWTETVLQATYKFKGVAAATQIIYYNAGRVYGGRKSAQPPNSKG